jgi:Protein of unknown function (DUF3106)
MFARRLIFALGLALMSALGAQSAPAQGRLRTARQERAQTWRERVQARRAARRERWKANHAARSGDAKGGARPAGDANKSANGGEAARPPNQDLFNPNPKVARRLPPGAMQRLRDMSPQQQEKFLDNNQRFQALPAERQAQIRRNLQRWNGLSPAEKDRLSHAERTWQRMNPEQRQVFRNQVLPKWQQMSPERRQLVIGRLHTLQGMTPSQREAALKDPRFMEGLTPDEQDVLRDLNSLPGSGQQ